MDERTFERRLLGLIFRSSLPLTPVHLAYQLDIPIAEARAHLDRMVTGGVLELDSDERGNIVYVYPMRPPVETLPPPSKPRKRRRKARRAAATTALVPIERGVEEERPASPVAAAALSLFLPGVGQIYSGRVLQGIGWMLATGGGYLLFLVPGLILHVCCIVNAALGPPAPSLQENVA